MFYVTHNKKFLQVFEYFLYAINLADIIASAPIYQACSLSKRDTSPPNFFRKRKVFFQRKSMFVHLRLPWIQSPNSNNRFIHRLRHASVSFILDLEPRLPKAFATAETLFDNRKTTRRVSEWDKSRGNRWTRKTECSIEESSRVLSEKNSS